MSDIVISEFMAEDSVARLRRYHAVHYDPDLVNQPAALAAEIADARILIVRNRTPVTAALLDRAPNLKAVGRLGIGLDNIDQAACAQRGIQVMPATGANTDAVAEYVIAAALMLRRGAYHSSDAVLSGAWPRAELVGREVTSATIGFIGFGAIARAVWARADALGMTAIAYDPLIPGDDPVWQEMEVEQASLEDLLASADIVSLHVPLSDQTRGLLGRDALARMKDSAILINTARGGIIDEAALAEALKAGRLGGAAIDVFAEEPLGADTPLRAAPRLIATPHIAGVTEESNQRVSDMIAERVLSVLEGA
jgi:(S)-sulfolactate dehydrogenase